MIDALLTLPFLSFLAVPTFSSWSTSLNLLFFWMTWSTLVLSYQPLHVEVIATVAVRTFFFLLPALAFLLFDYGVPSVAVMLKQRGEAAMPGNRGGRALAKIAGVAVANVALEVALQAAVQFLSATFLGRSPLKVTTRLPLPWGMAKHLVYALVIRGVSQYYIHKNLLHSKQSQALTNMHCCWHHSLKLPFSIVAAYDHPLVYILHWWIPLYVPAYLFRMHILTFQLLLALTSLEQLFTYSGYSTLPSTIMLNGMARRAEAHMVAQEGNYAPFGVLDWAHGTTVGGDVIEDLTAEMNKRDVSGKADKAMDKGGNMIGDMADKAQSKKGKGKK